MIKHSKYFWFLIFIFFFNLSNKEIVLSNVQNTNNSLVSTDTTLLIKNLEVLSKLKLQYNFPNILQPKLIYNSSDTINISNLVQITSLNQDIVNQLSKNHDRYKESVKIINVANYREIGSYLICLTSNYYRKDILIWKIAENGYNLLGVYPCAIGICLYCDPDFLASTNDTIKIGTENIDMEDIYGSYNYFVIENDIFRLAKQIIISGTYSYDERVGNPINGATSRKYLTIYYNENNEKTYQNVDFKCVNKEGKPICARAKKEELTLYNMNPSGNIGYIIGKQKIEMGKFNVGISIFYHGKSYIAVKINNIWYWALRNELIFDN